MPVATTDQPIACSCCFSDAGLRLDAERTGLEMQCACPNCGRTTGRKLSAQALESLAYQFFVWGSLRRSDYGAAPLIQFNQYQTTSIDIPRWLLPDVRLIERLLGIGFFYYGPRMWMLGEVKPLKALQETATREAVIDRIVNEYPEYVAAEDHVFYRVRKAPSAPAEPSEYDSPPDTTLGGGRLDSPGFPVLYASPDLELCVHECRFMAEDELFVATMAPRQPMRLLDLSVVLAEERVTEFESLDMAVHLLFLASKHSYPITRDIAKSASAGGFDGVLYPSYFSLLRLGVEPFPTAYGLSHRRFPQLRPQQAARTAQNIAIFGRPVTQGLVAIQCINRLMLRRVGYDFHFGPAA